MKHEAAEWCGGPLHLVGDPKSILLVSELDGLFLGGNPFTPQQLTQVGLLGSVKFNITDQHHAVAIECVA